MTPAIKITGLVKAFGSTKALLGVDLEIAEGQFYGLLGPNGAGKSTTINILTGLVRKDGGSTAVFGRDTVKDFRFTRAQLGIAAQELSVDWFFPIEKLLAFQAGYYGITEKQAQPRIGELLERLGLAKKRNSRLRHLSGGMKRRFQLAKALIHDPRIIILDEPTAGVDVELRHELWDYLRELHKSGKTILLTTHYIEEAELLCEEVAIINEGKIIKVGNPQDLTSDLGRSGLTINISGWQDSIGSLLEQYTCTDCDDGRLHFTMRNPEQALPEILKILVDNGVHIHRVEMEKSSLEDVFLSLTGKGIS